MRDSFEAAGYAPGVILGDRYRVIGLIGQGGMGEVYRADDLKLGHPVALKFLPEAMTEDSAWIERFYAEVRHARQISHPNVCRVYDVSEVGGRHFLSMEYIDGEDLASLLRRIGRLGGEKSLEIARQICAGLAAAHERGVLHRDLKPGNVMLDGRGRVRITDFGLAVQAGDDARTAEIAGTPAYMAPEQLAGGPATVQSDLYSLGLLLYELFTGRKPFEAATMPELLRKQREEAPPSPSALAREIDPAAERVILRCLEKDPANRPRSALSVAAAFPGGDPLAAALAAGETPSPDMVAAAGEPGTMRPMNAWAVLILVLTGLVLAAFLSPRVSLHGKVPIEKTADALKERAREILARLGYPEKPVGTAHGFQENDPYLKWVEAHDRAPDRWEDMSDGRPAAVLFSYRQSPEPLRAENFFSPAPFNGIVGPDDPPFLLPRMANVTLDSLGRLLRFARVPAREEAPEKAPASTPDWSVLFSEAGLDPARFARTEPRFVPPTFADSRAAWIESGPAGGRAPVRLEAAGYRGRVVSFETLGPWDRGAGAGTEEKTRGRRAAELITSGLMILLLCGGLVIARHNLRLQRGDQRGAFRLATFVFGCILFTWALAANHVAALSEFALFVMIVSWGLFVAAFVWMLYIALEPFVRRRWPDTIISWTRLLSGRWNDPRVGRDVLVGSAVGVASVLVSMSLALLRAHTEAAPPRPRFVFLFTLTGPRNLIGDLGMAAAISLFSAVGVFFLLFLLRLLLRRELLAGAVLALLLTFSDGNGTLLTFAVDLLLNASLIYLLIRFGLLAVASAVFFTHLLNHPLTTDFSQWYAGSASLPIFVTAGLAVWSFRTALGGRSALSSLNLEKVA